MALDRSNWVRDLIILAGRGIVPNTDSIWQIPSGPTVDLQANTEIVIHSSLVVSRSISAQIFVYEAPRGAWYLSAVAIEPGVLIYASVS